MPKESTTLDALAPPEAVEELLRQLVDARFVLTDRSACITRWSRPAEVVFGWPASAMVGRGLLETLAIPGSIPPSGGHLEAAARRKDGSEVRVDLTLVPVQMAHSLEFNGFLEALEIVGPRVAALERLQKSHRTVVDWIAAAIAGHAEAPDDQPAGTIVAFRGLDETLLLPPVEQEEETRPAPEPGAAAAAAASEDRDRAVAELADARAQAAAAAERIAELESTSGRLDSELAETRGALEQMQAHVEALRGELTESRSALEERDRSSRQELDSRLEETREELSQLGARLGESREEELQAELESTQARLAGFEDLLAERDYGARLDETRAQIAALGEQLAARGPDESVAAELEQTRAMVTSLEEALRDDETGRGLRDELQATAEKVAVLERALADDPRFEELRTALTAAREDGSARSRRPVSSSPSSRSARLRDPRSGADRAAGLRARGAPVDGRPDPLGAGAGSRAR